MINESWPSCIAKQVNSSVQSAYWNFGKLLFEKQLKEGYGSGVVSHPNKKSLWILSRTAKMDEAIYQQIIARLKENGFDLSKIQITKQL